jgi:putative SOS response-associated peptidase YedK
MCGRYQLVRPELLAQVYGLEQRTLDVLGLASNMNVRPTQRVPVLLGAHDAYELAVIRWATRSHA